MSDNPPNPGLQPRISAVIERLHALYPKMIDLSTIRLDRLLEQLGNPQLQLPPVIHVAGTNGKGSTCAFLRAIGEAAGLRVHVFTSPHLVRFNERIRVAGEIVDDATLEAALAEVERVNDGAAITVFEVLMGAAFLLFSRVPAELCVLEVGLGGRHDATNVVQPPVACAITSISLDHRDLLGPTIEIIAGEKAGIMKSGVPVVTGAQPTSVLQVFRDEAARVRTTLSARGEHWTIAATETGLRYVDRAGTLELPFPSLPGLFQHDNAGIAVAAIRASGLGISPSAIATGVGSAEWPGRLQRLTGRLAATIPSGWELWLDGGHNPGGGLALAEHARQWTDQPLHIIVGMKKAKDSAEFLRPLLPHATTLWAVSEPRQHLALSVDDIIAASGGRARRGPTIASALVQLPAAPQARILICGSLYLAGEVLKAD